MNNHEYAIEILKNVRNRAINMKVIDGYGIKFVEGVNMGLDFMISYIDYCIFVEKTEDTRSLKGGE